MSDYILKDFPAKQQLLKWYSEKCKDRILEVNAHLHTPYSFSAFENVQQIFDLAGKEGINVLGINDFYVADGYEAFYNQSLNYKIFPLFNIEFIGLLKEEQQQDIRVNDPNNPGRTYFCGKGLDYPFELDHPYDCILRNLKYESQLQVKEMIEKTSSILQEHGHGLSLKYSEIKRLFARELVRERHVARAVRSLIFKKFRTKEERLNILNKIYGSNESKVDIGDEAALENEIRSNILKAGGRAFVPENEDAFLPIPEIVEIILNAGGIPCYPVLLDDKDGNCTEYESDYQILLNELVAHRVYCIELIPGRNDINILTEFVRFFHENKFIITFGTEHNTPDLIPLKVSARKQIPLSEELLNITSDGACVIAAHQYLHAKQEEGFINLDGEARQEKMDDFIRLGKAVIEKFIA